MICLGIPCLGLLGACADDATDVEGELSFLVDRERWRATAVSATLDEVTTPEGTVEHTIQIVARRDPEGEQLTLFVVTPETVEGTHPVSAFGAFEGFAAQPAGLTPVTNVCGAGGEAAGSLTVERVDRDAGTLSGSFLVNVCDVQQAVDAKTLADGRFSGVPFVPGGGAG